MNKFLIILSSAICSVFTITLLIQLVAATDLRSNSTDPATDLRSNSSETAERASREYQEDKVNHTIANLPIGTLQIPYVGIDAITMTPELAKTLGFNESTKGIIVTEVRQESPAAIAGITGSNLTSSIFGGILEVGGDVVLSVDGNKSYVKSVEAFENYLEDKKVGENITLTTVRDGKETDIDLVIGALPTFYWYENWDEGIRIRYPSDWTVSEEDLSRQEIVKFYSAEKEGASDISTAAVLVKVLPPDDDTTLDTLAFQEREGSSRTRNLYVDSTSIGELPGYIGVSYRYLNDTTLKVLSAFTIKDENIYRIEFITETSRYNDYLPLALGMIRSFGFISQPEKEDFLTQYED